MPLGDDMEVGWNVEQALQQQGPGLRGQLLQRQDADLVVVHAQIAAMRLQLRIAHLPVEVACVAQRGVVDLGGTEVHETPDEPEYPFRP